MQKTDAMRELSRAKALSARSPAAAARAKVVAARRARPVAAEVPEPLQGWKPKPLIR
jgi:hypothetical protein